MGEEIIIHKNVDSEKEREMRIVPIIPRLYFGDKSKVEQTKIEPHKNKTPEEVEALVKRLQVEEEEARKEQENERIRKLQEWEALLARPQKYRREDSN